MRLILGLVICGLVALASSADDNTQATLAALGRQLMLQQFANQERVRNEGSSGIKQVRANRLGTRPYHTAGWTANSVASIHDHSNNVRTVGMGEFAAVLNGVEFKTRHNDYRLFQPHRTNSEYGATEEIEFPPVPPRVSNKPTVQDQIAEMREFFKAWKLQDDTHRDYKPYFKPILCYLEGGWTKTTGDIEESFNSDRHFLDASSWFELQEKVKFSAYAGRKSPLENYAFLPTALLDMINGTIPDFAQWNYRIACQPLKDDLPLNKLRIVDDLASRMKRHAKFDNFKYSRMARYQLSPYTSEDPKEAWPEDEMFNARGTLLDELMGQIPGKDNGPADIVDDAFDTAATEMGETGVPINAGYYHRWFEFGEKDAMGLSIQRRGYSDQQLFMALTTNPKIAAQRTEKCKKRWRKGKKQVTCQSWSQRWTYAIPLEIIFLTPLNRWNPYNIPYKGDERTSPEAASVTRDPDGKRRTGGKTPDKAYNGTHSRLYYHTPSEFYTGQEVNKDSADTSRGTLGVLDGNGDVKIVRASGTRIVLPEIDGIGSLRTRYPIMPVYYEGNPIYKELEALKDIVMESETYRYMLREKPFTEGSTGDGGHLFETSVSKSTQISEHDHEVTLTAEEMERLQGGELIEKTSTLANGHSHKMMLQWWGRRKIVGMTKCDGNDKCWDGHGVALIQKDGA